jgi:signal transduction histidine kinase/CheY-like chemotaxis protein/ABC-type amino acid transport substrate-binding protein
MIKKVLMILILFLICISNVNGYDKRGKEIKIGVFNFPPAVFINDKNEFDGFYIDILNYVAEKENWNVVYEENSWAENLTKIKNGDVDLIMSVAYTEERDKYMDYSSESIMSVWTEIYSTKKANIKNMFDLKDKKIGIMRADHNGVLFKDYVHQLNIKCTVVEYDDIVQVFESMDKNEISAGIINNSSAILLSKKYQAVRTNIILNPFLIYFAVPEGKNKYIINSLTKYLEKWKHDENSIYYSSLEFWLHQSSNIQKVTPEYVFYILLSLLLLVILGIVLFKYQLNKKNRALECTEEALEEEERFIKSVMDNLPIGVSVNSVDPSVDFSYMNDAFPKHYHTTREELEKPDNFWNAVFEDEKYREWIKTRVITDCETGDPKQMHWDKVEIKKDGNLIAYVDAANTPFEENQVMISTVIDVTNKVLTQQKLTHEEKKSLLWLEHSPVCTKILDKDYNLMYMSKSCIKSLEIKDLDSLYCQKYPFDFYPDEFNEKMISNLNKSKETGDVIEQEGFVYNKVNKKIWFHSTIVPVDDADDNLEYFIVVSADITRRIEAEKAKKKVDKQLIHSQKMEAIGTLASGIAHDFNNILTSMFGYTELLQLSLKDEKLLMYINEVSKANNRAKDLVGQILTFSKSNNIAKQPFQINFIINEVLQLLKSSIPATIKIQSQINSKEFVLCNSTQIHQVIMNLCTNAYQAMKKDGGKLIITLNEIEKNGDGFVPEINLKPGKYLKISICDTGPGIPDEIKDKIFEPYFTTKKHEKGTGLGLAIVHGIVQKHYGDISCYSEEGKGSSFHVYLPIYVKIIKTKKVKKIVENLNGTESILVVDDEISITKLLKHMLERYGYKVTPYTNSLKALEYFKNNDDVFDLLITDMTMPNLSGYDLAKKILKIRPNFPIILCTGHNEFVNKEIALKNGIKDYLEKPTSNETILRSIKKILKK